VACACALVDLWVLRLPCPVRLAARLSRPCPRRVGVVALGAHGGWGNGVRLIATEEAGARLVYSRLTLGRARRALGLVFVRGEGAWR